MELEQRILEAANRTKENGLVDESEIAEIVAGELDIHKVRDGFSWVTPAWLLDMVHDTLDTKW